VSLETDLQDATLDEERSKTHLFETRSELQLAKTELDNAL